MPRSRHDPLTVGALLVAVVSVSSSAPMIAYAAAPALALAFWRNALAVGVLAPTAAAVRRDELRALAAPTGRRELASCALSGLALAVHFGTWVPTSTEARMIEVPAGTVTSFPSISRVTIWSEMRAGVP